MLGCLRRRGRHRIVEQQNAPCLEAFRPVHRLAYDMRAFVCVFEAGLAYAALMQQDIALLTRRRLYEAITLREVKPLDRAGNFQGLVRSCGRCDLRFHPLPRRHLSFKPNSEPKNLTQFSQRLKKVGEILLEIAREIGAGDNPLICNFLSGET
jgi:hypothetical protein